jgi:hypothetical protein
LRIAKSGTKRDAKVGNVTASHRSLTPDDISRKPPEVVVQTASSLASTPGWQRHLPIALVVAFSAIVYWRLLDVFYYSNDDFPQFQAASQSGLSSELVWMNLFGHTAPINRLGHGATWWLFGLNPNGGALLVAGLVFCMLASTALLTYELGLSLMRRLLVLTIVGGSQVLLFATVWCDGAWHALPTLTATYAVAALHVHALRSGRARWHVLSVIVFAVGLMAQERTGFALPLLILVDVLLLWRHEPWGNRIRRLWLVRWPFIAMATLAALVAWSLYRNGTGAGTGDPLHLTPRTMLQAFTLHFFPQLAGLPSSTLPVSRLVQLRLLTVIAAVGAALMLWNRSNVGPALFVPAVFGMYWAFLVFDPMLNAGTSDSTAQGLGYAIYPFVPAVIAIFCLELPLVSTITDRMSDGQRIIAAGLTLALVFGWQVTTTGVFAASSLDAQRQSHEFLETADSSRSLWNDPTVTVVPLQAPPSISSYWALDYGREEFLLNLVEPGWTAGGDVTARTVILDPTGQMRDVALQPMTAPLAPSDADPEPGTCSSGTRTGAIQTYHYQVGNPGIQGTTLLTVSYTATSTGQLSVASSTGTTTVAARWPTVTKPGSHVVLIALPTDSVEAFDLSFAPTGSGSFCLDPPQVLRPELVVDGECQEIDQLGQPIGPSPCPPKN